MRYVWASGTHVGRVRESNQDAVFPLSPGAGPGPLLVAVADGMGGHVGGDIASRVAMEAASGAAIAAGEDVAVRLAAADQAIENEIAEEPALAGMGTTMSLGLIEPGGRMVVAHVGDSRAYLLREGRLRQLTVDHTLVWELVEKGLITAAEAERHPQRHVLTRVLLGEGGVAVDSYELQLAPGDRILFCSDGLTGMVSDDRLTVILAEADTPESAVWHLIETANAAGGLDNTTALVVFVTA